MGAASGGAAPTVGGEVSGTLNILVSSATGSDAGFKAVNEGVQAKYPGVKVNFSAVPERELRPDPLVPADRRQYIDVASRVSCRTTSQPANEGDDARLADQAATST